VSHWGKYRGKVLSTEDPMMSGRLLCEVAALPGMLLNWAMPAVPFAGIQEGFFALPEEGADVWVEFEAGDPSKPIWSGGYWEMGQEPLVPEIAPEAPELVTVLKTKFCTLLLNDTPEAGGVTMSVIDPAVTVPVTLTMSSLGFAVEVGELSLTMNPEVGITLTAGEVVQTITPEGVTVEAPTVEVEADASVSVTSPTTEVEGENVNITAAVEVEGPTTLTEEVTIGGELTVAGAAEFAGEVNISGAMTVEGDANFAGAQETEGEANFLGAVTIEGDLNVAGGQQTEGNNAVAGLIEGIVVPPGI
jgi:hypothetical protein